MRLRLFFRLQILQTQIIGLSFSIFFAFEIAYLAGAIPFSVLIGKLIYGKDVRKFGSGNAGATNTFRVLGKRAGSMVLLLDIAKGMFAVSLSYSFGNISMTDEKFILYQLALGVTAALGHIYPIYLWFKGGKGVATLFGVVIAVFPMTALVCMAVFFSVFFFTRYVSLSSISASIAFAIRVIFVLHYYSIAINIFSLLLPVLIIYTHRENINRLLKGTENRFVFKKKEETIDN